MSELRGITMNCNMIVIASFLWHCFQVHCLNLHLTIVLPVRGLAIT